jgi:hypothetical protein
MVPACSVFAWLRAHLRTTQSQAQDAAPTVLEVQQALDAMVIRVGKLQIEAAPTPLLQSARGDGATLCRDNDTECTLHTSGIDGLFTDLEQPVLQQPAPRRACQRLVFDMTNVHRSARLAKRPAIPAVERAQRNLCRKAQRNLYHKLGIPADEQNPLDNVLRDFISMFQGSLSENIVIAALSALFELDDDSTDLLDNALLLHAGQAVADLASAEEAA